MELLTGIRVSAKTQERIVERTNIGDVLPDATVTEMAVDVGMVRLVSEPGEPSEWKQYKAVRLNGGGVGMAYYRSSMTLAGDN